MHYSPSQKTLIVAILFSVGGLVLFSTVVVFSLKNVSEVKSPSSDNRGGVEDILRIKKEAYSLKDEVGEVQSFFVQPGEEPYFVDKVENIAKSLSLKIQTSSISETNSVGGGSKSIEVNLEYEGTLINIVAFLKKIETMPYVVKIKNLNVNLTEGGDWSGTVSLSALKAKNPAYKI